MRAERRAWAAVLFAAILTACGTSDPKATPPSAPAAPAPTTTEAAPLQPGPTAATTGLSDFASIAQLQALFDQRQDAPQLVLLLSPT